MNLPKDPVMLLSVINTALRDHYESLDELCASNNVQAQDIVDKLKSINYIYDSDQNQFI